MNWKNVLYLLRVDRKSGRLIRGIKATKYRENAFIAYWPYWVAGIIGVLAGIGAVLLVPSVLQQMKIAQPLGPLVTNLFAVLPTSVFIVSLVFSLLQQIQIAGLKPSGQVTYALPITWQEHTMASILSNLLGWPAAFATAFSVAILIFSAFNGLMLPAILTVLLIFAAAFMGSSITESLRIVQMRLSGAVTKSSGRAAIWSRFIVSIFIFISIYVVYFYIVNGGYGTLINGLSSTQNTIWYVPFIWLAQILSNVAKGFYLQAGLFTVMSALFLAILYYIAVYLNQRFGLYEPPAITLSKAGIYAPKAGTLGKFGFSTVEAALIRKDLRAFSRRRELLGVYIAPIIMMIIPIMNSLGVLNQGGGGGGTPILIFEAIMFIGPAAFMSMLLGEVLIGEEGQSVWRIYASPISPKELVKSKYFFVVLFSTIFLAISGIVGILFYHPSFLVATVGILEGFLASLAIASLSLTVGLKGPDFSMTRRARMVRQEWALLAFVFCSLAGIAVGAPIVPLVILHFLGSSVSLISVVIALAVSAVISVVISAIFYRVNIGLAADLLKKAET